MIPSVNGCWRLGTPGTTTAPVVGTGATVVVTVRVLAIVYTSPIVDAIAYDRIGEGEGNIHGWWMETGAVGCMPKLTR